MATTVFERKKVDESRSAGWQESSDAPDLLAAYMARIGRGRLLTAGEEISLQTSACRRPESLQEARRAQPQACCLCGQEVQGDGATHRGPHPGGQHRANKLRQLERIGFGFDPPSRTDRTQAIGFRSRKSPGCSNIAPSTPPGASSTAMFYLQNALFFE